MLFVDDLRGALIDGAKEIYGLQDRLPVPLKLTVAPADVVEDFGREQWQEQLDSTNVSQFIELDQVFELASKKAHSESQKYRKLETQEAFRRKRQNVVGVVGTAGIGKTTLSKILLESVVEEDSQQNCIFYILAKDLDFDKKKYSVLQFLTITTLSEWNHTNSSDRCLLSQINTAAHVYIIIDGLDEARINKGFPKMKLNDVGTADAILKNLLSGNILPRAKKLVTSRPEGYHLLPNDCKPLFMVRVLGLDRTSQRDLCQSICESEDEFKLVEESLALQPVVSSLCYIPVYCIMIVDYILSDLTRNSTQLISVTDVLSSTFLDWLESPHFKAEPDSVRKLADLAFRGIVIKQFLFDTHQLSSVGLDPKAFEPFLNAKVVERKSRTHRVRILEGTKKFFFSHLVWQEFFAALHLVFLVDPVEFEKNSPLLVENRWEIVVKFMFGFFNPSVLDKLAAVFPEFGHKDLSLAKDKLCSIALEAASEYAGSAVTEFPISPVPKVFDIESWDKINSFLRRPKDTDFYKLCNWCFESKDANFTRRITVRLPQTILISRTVLPSEMSALEYFLVNSHKKRFINVGAVLEPATFVGNAATFLLRSVLAMGHKVFVAFST